MSLVTNRCRLSKVAGVMAMGSSTVTFFGVKAWG